MKNGKMIYYYKMPDGSIRAGNEDQSDQQDLQDAGQNLNQSRDENAGENTQQTNPELQTANEQIKPQPPLKELKDGLEKYRQQLNEQKFQEWDMLADHYINKAKQQKELYLTDMDDIARENGLRVMPSEAFGAFAIKDKQSIFNKFERNEAKDTPDKNNKLTDLLRTTLVINSPSQFTDIKQSLEKKGYKIWNDDVENLYDKKGAGYKHIAMKIVKGDNDEVVKELLLMRPNMLEAKFALGHDLYDIDKNIITAFPRIQSDPDLKTNAEKFKNALLEISKRFYESAYYRDLESESAESRIDDVSANEPYPAQEDKNKNKSSSLSSAEPKRLALEVKSSLKRAIQPILAKFRNSSGVSENSPDLASAIALILSSIVQPSLNLVDKYAKGQLPLFKANVTKRKSRFNKIMQK
jgi:hypothetical protein